MISSEWVKDIANKPEEKESFINYLGNNQRLLKRFKDILEERDRGIESINFSLSSFEDSSWSCKQAFLLGQRSILKDLIKLVDIG